MFSVKYISKQMSEKVVVNCYRLLGVTSFVLKVRSWSGNNVPIYLYQMNVIFCHSCPVKRGQSLKAQLSPWNVPSWISRNRSHWPAPSGQGSHILHRFPPSWGQAPNPIGPVSSACPSEDTSYQRLRPVRWPLQVGCRDRDGGEVHRSSRPGPRLLEGLSESSGALQDVVPSLLPWDLQLTHWPKAGWYQSPPKECQNLPLLSFSSWWPPHHPSLITSVILPSWQ